MTDTSHAHDIIVWTKQRLDQVDATILAVEKSAENLKDNARAEVDRSLARLRNARSKLQAHVDSLRTEAAAVKQHTEELKDAIDAEWIEAESAFQSFVTAVGDRADMVRSVMLARAHAQRESWNTFLTDLRGQAADVAERARGDLETAIQHLSNEAEKLQGRLGDVKDAGGESWEALKSGLAGAKDVQHRTIQKIKEAFSRLR